MTFLLQYLDIYILRNEYSDECKTKKGTGVKLNARICIYVHYLVHVYF